MTDIPTYNTPVASLDADLRGTFVIKVYQHVLLAVGLFVAFEAVLFSFGIAEAMYDFFASGGGIAWLLLLGGFTAVNWIATQASHDLGNTNKQYAGLAAMAAAEAFLFAPFLYYVFNQDGGTVTVGAAAVITLIGFALLSVVAFVTRKDLSFLRPMIMWGFGIAMLAIFGAILFGFELGVWFSVAMIGLAGASILYQTQSIMARYPNDAYVGAAVQLFGSLMMMFWYVLRLLSRR